MRSVCLPLLLLAAFARAEKLPELAVPDALGVNIHFTDPRPGEMKMLADAGFKWVRMDFTWGGTERKAGEYNFEAYDRLLAALQPHGIRAVFILDYSNRLYDHGLSPHTDEGRAAMAKWAAAAVAHFKGKGVVWEMWNEPNIAQFWKPKPNADDYAKLALEVGKAIRAVAPEEVHVGPATSTIDLKFIETCFKAGLLEYWDAVSVHPYRQKDPETACEEYRKLRLLIAKYAPKGKKIPILSGEWGYSSAWSGFDEARQAKYLPRQLLTNLYNEIPISIWYDWHDDGQDPKEGEHHFGTVHNAYRKDVEQVYEPKPAYLAMKTLTGQLGGFSYSKRLTLKDAREAQKHVEDDDWVMVFSKAEDVRIVAWTTSAVQHQVVVPLSQGSFHTTNHLGEKGPLLKANAAGLHLTLTDTPLYLTPDVPNDFLRVIAAWERMPLEVMAWPPDSASIDWAPVNPLTRMIRMNNHNILPGGAEDVPLREGQHHVRMFGSTQTLRPQLTRSSPPRREFWEMRVDGMGYAAQSTLVVVVNPIDFRLYPPVGKSITVGVSNPSGDAFEGDMTVNGIEDSSTPAQHVKFAQGAKEEVFLRFPIRGPADRFNAHVKILSDKTVIAQSSGHHYQLLADTASERAEDRYRIASDGDRKVTSTQVIGIDTAPAPTPTGDDRPVLKLTYSFEPGWKYLQVKPASDKLKEITGKPKELGLWLFGDGSRTSLRLRFTDSIGQTFQATGPMIDFMGWRYVTIPMDGPDLHHWGKGDGQIHYPIKWDTLLLIDNVTREKTAGELYFTGLTLTE